MEQTHVPVVHLTTGVGDDLPEPVEQGADLLGDEQEGDHQGTDEHRDHPEVDGAAVHIGCIGVCTRRR